MEPRRTTARGLQTMERLRSAARAAFDELGWQGTRVQDIAERAGVSHGTFYTYYNNRNAILVDLVNDTMAAFVELVGEPWDGDEPGRQLEDVLRGFLTAYGRDAAVMRTWLQASREAPEFGELYIALRKRFVDRITDQLTRVVTATGRGDAVPPVRAVASSLAAMVEHVAYSRYVLGEDHDEQDLIDAVVLVWGSTVNALAGFDVIGVTTT